MISSRGAAAVGCHQQSDLLGWHVARRDTIFFLHKGCRKSEKAERQWQRVETTMRKNCKNLFIFTRWKRADSQSTVWPIQKSWIKISSMLSARFSLQSALKTLLLRHFWRNFESIPMNRTSGRNSGDGNIIGRKLRKERTGNTSYLKNLWREERKNWSCILKRIQDHRQLSNNDKHNCHRKIVSNSFDLTPSLIVKRSLLLI